MKSWCFYVSPVLLLLASCAQVPFPSEQLVTALSDTPVEDENFKQIPVQIIQEWDSNEVPNLKNLQLSNKCPFHEVFVDCPDAHICQQTCATLNEGCVVEPDCEAACFCKEGFARNSNKKCVPISECPGE